jgi:uncharacterized Zn-binding protein involved in type VI secretion
MAAVHRHEDARACGATTVVSGNTTVYANSKLIAINGNINSHGAGALTAGSNNVFIGGIAVVNNTPDSAAIDTLEHTNTQTAAGSLNVNVGD